MSCRKLRYGHVLNELRDIFNKKNADYGDSVGLTFSKYGIVSYLVRIADKYNRLENLYKSGITNVYDETFRDTLLDLANYCILAAIDIEED